MMYHKIDEYGYFVEDVVFLHNEEPTEDLIPTPCPDGFYKPRWDGEDWIEGLTQGEIEIIRNQTQPQTTEERLEELVNNLTDMQMAVMFLSLE